MALVIEDGSIVPGADSFATLAEFITYADNLGLAIPDTTGAQEALLRKAYKAMKGKPWKGRPVSAAQTGAWPRSGVCKDGFVIPSNVIPEDIKNGQMALSAEVYADEIDPPHLRKGPVIKNRVEGAVEQQYGAASKALSTPVADTGSANDFCGYLSASNQMQMVRG